MIQIFIFLSTFNSDMNRKVGYVSEVDLGGLGIHLLVIEPRGGGGVLPMMTSVLCSAV